MDVVLGVLDKLVPAFVKKDGTWQFVSGAILGWCVKNTVDRLLGSRSNEPPRVQQQLIVPRPTEELKMVLCVNESLKMGKGKIGAQCAHAACGIIQKYRSKDEVLFRQWEYCGQAKIAVKVQNEDEMRDLAMAAFEQHLPVYTVQDAGRTQIPAGSRTVLAIGPAPRSLLDTITGHLKLM